MGIILRRFAVLILFVGFLIRPFPTSAQLIGALGGIEGVGEETTAAPILTMTGEVDFKEGAGAIGLAYAYTRFTRLFGGDIEDPSKEFGIPTQDSNRALESTQRVFLLGYGMTSRLNLGIEIPFNQDRSRYPLSATGPAEEQEAHGIGNIDYSVKYQLSSSPNLAVRLRATLPSGYETGDDYLKWAGAIAYSTRWERFSVHVQGGYVWTDRDRQNQDHPDLIAAALAAARSIGDHVAGFLELTYRQRVGKDDSTYLNPPTQTSLELIPGFKIEIKENFTLASAVRIALIDNFEFGYDASYLFVAGYAF